jgi:hypothetical protein
LGPPFELSLRLAASLTASRAARRCFSNGMPQAGRALATAIVAAPLAPAAAGAAVVRLDRLEFDCTRRTCPPSYAERLVVRAGCGEDNRFSVARGAAGEFQARMQARPPGRAGLCARG